MSEHDALVILRNVDTGLFHCAFLLGNVGDANSVHLSTRRVARDGLKSFAEAQALLVELAIRHRMDEENVGRGTAVPWNGAAECWTVADWRREPVNVLVVMT